MTTPTPAPVSKAAPVKIKYKSGLEEAIRFPDLDIFERQEAITLLVEGKSPELVMLCLRRGREWLNSLEPASYLALVNPAVSSVFPWALMVASQDPIMGLKWGPVLMQMSRLLSSVPGPNSSATPSSDSESGSTTSTEPAPLASAAQTGEPAPGTLPAGSAAS